MRVNARKVFQAFHAGRYYKKTPSFWTDGVAMYSYGTTLFEYSILAPDTLNPVYFFNDTRYSITTTIYQNSICEEFGIDRNAQFSSRLDKFIVVLQNVPRGAYDLAYFAKPSVA